MKTALLTGFLLLAAAAQAQPYYKWVDENGVTHYSDKPHPNAETVELASPQTYTAVPVPQRASPREATDTSGYDNFEVAEPVEDKVYWNIEGNLGVRLRLRPSLARGHSVYVYLNGQRVDGLPTNSLSVTVPEVWRGTHTLTATVSNRDGDVIDQTDPVTFHVRQTSIQNPAATPGPGTPPRPTPTPGRGGS